MSVGRLSVSAGRKGKGSPHAEYIAREGKYAKPDDDLEKLEFVGVGNMPTWAKDKPNFFWKMSDEHERANGTAYREHVISLPRELSPDQRHDLILDWIEQEIGDKHAYQYAIHNPPASDGKEQPHCHLMFCEREIDGIERAPDQYFKRYNAKNPDKGGAKKANTGMKPADRKADLLAQRGRWEDTCNKHLELANSKSRINMKSYKERGMRAKSLNYDMKDLHNPEVRATQAAALAAKSEYITARRDSLKINIRDEINNLTRAAELKRQQEQAEPVRETATSRAANFNFGKGQQTRAADTARKVEHSVEHIPAPEPKPRPKVKAATVEYPRIRLKDDSDTSFYNRLTHMHYDAVNIPQDEYFARFIDEKSHKFDFEVEQFRQSLSSNMSSATSQQREDMQSAFNTVRGLQLNIKDFKEACYQDRVQARAELEPRTDSIIQAHNNTQTTRELERDNSPSP